MYSVSAACMTENPTMFDIYLLNHNGTNVFRTVDEAKVAINDDVRKNHCEGDRRWIDEFNHSAKNETTVLEYIISELKFPE